MNTYKKFCPNVFVASCDEQHEKGDSILITTRYGKENEHIVHNLVGHREGKYFYSITRKDGYNTQKRAANKAKKYSSWSESSEQKSESAFQKSKKDSEFLSLGEPIKIGHHSEKRHRKLFEQANNNMRKCVEFSKKAEEHQSKAEYWESMADKIDLSMPESIEYFKYQYEKALEFHTGMKEGKIKRAHSYSLTYAKKECNELKKKYDLAIKLWA